MPEVLLAMKINSVVLRDKEHKRYKDICDIVALCLFSELEINEIIDKSKKFISKNKLEKFKKIEFRHDIENCNNILGLETNTIKTVIDKIKEISI